MAVEIPYRRQLEFEYGKAEVLSPGIRRVIANNPGPFTFHGTGTYILGTGQVAVIDPGPDDQEHIDAILASLQGETVSHILLPIRIWTIPRAVKSYRRLPVHPLLDMVLMGLANRSRASR